MFLSQGRSGILIFIIEVLCISIILNPNIKKLYKFFLGLVIIGLFFTSTIQNNLESLSYVIEPYNPRIAGFIRQDGESDINQDKSLMIRLMMIDKTIEIFYEYPVLGIGAGMFTKYNSELTSRDNYDRLDNKSDEYLNTRSSHGSYYQVLAEFGIVGLIFIILILIRPILYVLKRLLNNKNGNEDFFLISLLGISLHFVAVSALTGTIPWVIIGVGWNLRNNKSLR
jgi:O-antigen ligase